MSPHCESQDFDAKTHQRILGTSLKEISQSTLLSKCSSNNCLKQSHCTSFIAEKLLIPSPFTLSFALVQKMNYVVPALRGKHVHGASFYMEDREYLNTISGWQTEQQRITYGNCLNIDYWATVLDIMI